MLVASEDLPVLALQGRNLATEASVGDFPLATLNDTPVRVVNATAREVRIALQPGLLHEGVNELRVALDPYAVITLDVNA
jgi:hypothetical protein